MKIEMSKQAIEYELSLEYIKARLESELGFNKLNRRFFWNDLPKALCGVVVLVMVGVTEWDVYHGQPTYSRLLTWLIFLSYFGLDLSQYFRTRDHVALSEDSVVPEEIVEEILKLDQVVVAVKDDLSNLRTRQRPLTFRLLKEWIDSPEHVGALRK